MNRGNNRDGFVAAVGLTVRNLVEYQAYQAVEQSGELYGRVCRRTGGTTGPSGKLD